MFSYLLRLYKVEACTASLLATTGRPKVEVITGVKPKSKHSMSLNTIEKPYSQSNFFFRWQRYNSRVASLITVFFKVPIKRELEDNMKQQRTQNDINEVFCEV